MCACWLVKDRPANTGKKEVQTQGKHTSRTLLVPTAHLPKSVLESFY